MRCLRRQRAAVAPPTYDEEGRYHTCVHTCLRVSCDWLKSLSFGGVPPILIPVATLCRPVFLESSRARVSRRCAFWWAAMCLESLAVPRVRKSGEFESQYVASRKAGCEVHGANLGRCRTNSVASDRHVCCWSCRPPPLTPTLGGVSFTYAAVCRQQHL
jgi:hypothetical protein